jgi:hypothetical protein
MYKIEINIGEYSWSTDLLTIETDDFDKIAIIQEFIEFQKMYGWAVDYDVTDEYEYLQEDDEEGVEFGEDDDKAEEDEEVEVGEVVEDEDGMVWERVA